MAFPTGPIREGLSGSTLIAAGVGILLLAIGLPGVPLVTAMSLVALGTTDVTLTRFRGAPVLVPALLLHTIVYGGLYSMFIGATLHAVTESSAEGLGLPTMVDLIASTIPAAAALRNIVLGLRSQLVA